MGCRFQRPIQRAKAYRDASHQIKHYLENVKDIEWGILTNGRKWRLYGTKDYETKTYYEVDLPELLEQGDVDQFKYFYAFFRPETFRETAGSTFLETVWSESETASQELGKTSRTTSSQHYESLDTASSNPTISTSTPTTRKP